MSRSDDQGSVGNFPRPQPGGTEAPAAWPDPATRTTVEPDGKKVTTDARDMSDPARLEHDRREPIGSGGDASLDATLACSDVTGIDCDFVASPDHAASWAKPGQIQEQLLAQITTHIGKEHPENVLPQERIEEIREQLVS